MYCRWTLFKLEIKRLIGLLPLIMLETLLFGLIVFGAGAFAAKAVYGEKAVSEIKVGIVAEQEDSLTRMLVKFVQSMDSLKNLVTFDLMSEKEARTHMEKGEIYAAIMIPAGIIDSVISGENVPATILLDNSYSQMETEVFSQLTRSGAKLLTVAQAGIYAADEFCVENGMQDRIPQTEDELNETYLKYALGRTAIFRGREVNAVKGVGLIDYYGISMLLAFMSFAGLSFGRCLQVRMGEREKMIGARGISTGGQYLIEAGAFSLVFALLGMMISLPVYLLFVRHLDSSFKVAVTWIFMLVLWFAEGTFLRMLLQITGNSVGGIGVCFVILMAAMFASGVFLPPAFLPLWVERLGNDLPYKKWMDAMAVILQGRFEGQVTGELVRQIFIFLLTGTLAAALRNTQIGRSLFKKMGTGGKYE